METLPDQHTKILASKALLAARQGTKRGKPERSLLTLDDLNNSQMHQLLEGGLEMKQHPERFERALQGKSVALLFQKTSTRTRCSFEIGVGEMSGIPMYMEWKTSNFTLADLADEARALSRYVDLIVARVYHHTDLLTMKKHSEVPIVNGLCDRYHPCQGLADFMTLREYFGDLKGLNLCYIGDGNNVCHTLIQGAVKVGMHITVAHPPQYPPDADLVAAAQTHHAITLTQDPRAGVQGADAIYTDTWISMGDESETQTRLHAFQGFQVNQELLAHTPEHALIMHCLPAHRGYEISSEALDSPNSVIFDQAENRKHVQKFLLAWILEQV
ncbi:ornithine carbamoyltransferase [Anthocerotibacter panamensis]|uniref:ornithine carbamoyltransferase n=1 Tax=Anthocerotibacter panamensis TaxID=2857077 RepID=UPI001C407D3B|nr:ornithine carbamoyltransferase [Anthocerotibacter panamensis]